MTEEQSQQSSHLPSLDKPMLAVKATMAKAICWFSAVVFLFGAVVCYPEDHGYIWAVFLLLAATSVFWNLIHGELRMSSEDIIYATPLGKYRMKWDDVKQVDMDPKDGALAFYAEDRSTRMAVVGPMFWWGRDKRELRQLLDNEVEKRRIPVKRTARASYTLCKNTKVS